MYVYNVRVCVCLILGIREQELRFCCSREGTIRLMGEVYRVDSVHTQHAYSVDDSDFTGSFIQVCTPLKCMKQIRMDPRQPIGSLLLSSYHCVRMLHGNGSLNSFCGGLPENASNLRVEPLEKPRYSHRPFLQWHLTIMRKEFSDDSTFPKSFRRLASLWPFFSWKQRVIRRQLLAAFHFSIAAVGGEEGRAVVTLWKPLSCG